MGTAMLLAAAGAMLEIVPRLAPVLAGSVLFGAAIPWLVVALMTLAQRLTPPDLQGRVFAASETLISTPQTVSIAIGAALVSVVGYQLLLLVMATVFVLAASYLLTRSQQGSARPPAALRVRPNAQEGGTGFGLRDR
jgi:predicted MFS family arabinose efflux permease